MGDNPKLIHIIFVLLIYFLPTIVAWCRWHRNEYAIGMLNTFLGWTFIGWAVALVWAYVDNTQPHRTRSSAKPKPALPIRRAAN